MDKADRLQTVLRKLFRPLARVMIAHGVTISVATELLKRALVEVVETDGAREGHVTDSRVSLMTGLHRKDVRRLRRQEPVPTKRSFEGGCALVVAYWTADERFLDRAGKPRKLVLSPRPRRVTFRALVQAAGLDVPAATVLEELERTGVVAPDHKRSSVTLVKRAYLPDRSSPAKLEAFEKNLEAHLSAASANLIGDEEPFFERAAHFNNLSAASITRLSRKADKLMQAALEALNQTALGYQRRDSGKPANKHRISLGAYVFTRVPKEKAATPSEAPSAGDDA